MSHDEFSLTLADGTRLVLCAGDATAARILAFLAEAARLQPEPVSSGVRRLMAMVEGHAAPDADAVCVLEPRDAKRPRLRAGTDRTLAFVPEPVTGEQWFWTQLVRLSACIAGETLPRGGVLLHSGLAAIRASLGPGSAADLEHGVLMAGRSGVGKSTASRRLPRPWHALADDVTLVVRAPTGDYWAHPWPTWSRFFGDQAGDGSDTWDVQQAVPLRAIFVLEQGTGDQAEPLGPGHAVALLAELARQTSTNLMRGWPPDRVAAFNRQRFENLCDLVRAVPAYLLHVSLDGTFWEEIERVMTRCHVG